MSTQEYRTKTIIMERKNVSNPHVWGVAIDVGYSGTKVFSPNIIACFPSYAVRVMGDMLKVASKDKSAILYRDTETGEVWKVGRIAQNSISPQDPDASSLAIYGRQRYASKMFMVIFRTALGLAVTPNQYGSPDGMPIAMETGLPNTYIKNDSPILRSTIVKNHSFDLKISSGDWRHYDINLENDNLFIMPQPMGTLLSIATDDNARSIPEAASYYQENVLICDPGFGTLDCFTLKGGEMSGYETYDSLGMKRVLVETSDKLQQDYGIEMPVPAMQKALEDGYVTQFDVMTRQGVNIDFSKILDDASKMVAKEAVNKLCEIYNNLLDFKYFVLTGGTGEAWYPIFKEELSGMPNLIIIPGNQNTDGVFHDENGKDIKMPFFFSNVRGYYMYLQNRFKR